MANRQRHNLAAELIVVEPTLGGSFAVTVRPIFRYCELERAFPIVGDALDYAELLAGELDCRVLDLSGLAAG